MAFRPLSIVIGLVAAISYPYWHSGTSAPSGTIEDKVQTVAEAMSAVTPKALGDREGTLTAVTAQGRTLIFYVSGIQSWEPYFSTLEMTKIYTVTVCKESSIRRLIEQGGALKMQAKDTSGRPLPSISISSCPG